MDIKNNILKTGTTTIGIVTKDGVVLAADKQGSYGGGSGVAYVAGKVKKIHKFDDDLIMTIAGAASMALRAIQNARAHIRIKDLKQKNKSTIKEIGSLFSHIALQAMQSGGVVSFLLAGKENGKSLLYEVSPDGMIDEIADYKASGSGMMHINAMLDTEYKEGMSLEEGVEMARKCIIGSSGRDPATGIGYEIWAVTPEEIKKVEDKTWKRD